MLKIPDQVGDDITSLKIDDITNLKTDDITSLKTNVITNLKTNVIAGLTGNLRDMGLKNWFKKKVAEMAEEDKEFRIKMERDIIMALRQVYDPEIPVNVYDLGLIYEIRVDPEHDVYIQMTLTAPNCPMADYVVEQVKTAVEDVPGVVSVTIDLVFEPVWDKSRMSEEALVELGLDD